MSVSAERLAQARTVADAVLYEGYLLYPYRASSEKNQNRWQFGVLGPPGAADRGLGEAGSLTMTTLLTEVSADAALTVHLRFLQLQHRQVLDADGVECAELQIGPRRELTWDEAVEQELVVRFADLPRSGHAVPVPAGESGAGPLRVPGGADVEELRTDTGAFAGSVVRRRWELRAQLVATVEEHGSFRLLRVQVCNTAPDRPNTKDEATRTSLLGAHLLVELDGARFVSMIDPPAHAEPVTSTVHQDRCWPFLCGEPGSTDLLLGSPIILYDYPELAPESAGPLFDGTEIDEILTLRVMTMTAQEKAEARATDPRAAAIIDRCEAMSAEELQQLHGVFRDPRGPAGPPAEALDFPIFTEPGADPDPAGAQPWWDPASDAGFDPARDTVMVRGVPITKGSVVRLRPSRTADAQDLFFADRLARVTAVLFDVDGSSHVAVVLADDPAADLHEWYGRYLYFGPEEIEPVPRQDVRPPDNSRPSDPDRPMDAVRKESPS